MTSQPAAPSQGQRHHDQKVRHETGWRIAAVIRRRLVCCFDYDDQHRIVVNPDHDLCQRAEAAARIAEEEADR